jgi:hypothetical protein
MYEALKGRGKNYPAPSGLVPSWPNLPGARAPGYFTALFQSFKPSSVDFIALSNNLA